MGLVRSHRGNLGLRQPDGEQQSRHQPAGNRFDLRADRLHLGSATAMDDLPEARLGHAQLISHDPMEQIGADLGVFVVRDLRPEAGPVR